MRILYLLLFCSVFSLNSFSQISFEKGYFITNLGQKVECEIRNVEWKDNPSQFKYKAKNSSEVLNKTIESVKEFGIYEKSKYVRFLTNIDRSSKNTNELSDSRNAKFSEEQLFLKLLIDGQASLYEYNDGILTRYFFTINNSDIEQLVYKQYLSTNNKIGTNNRFRQQLGNNLKCPTISKQQIDKLNYKKRQLINLFIKYNECMNQSFVIFEKEKKKSTINFSIRPGLNSSSLEIYNNNTFLKNGDFGNKQGIRFGIEIEFVMPFNKNKWAFIIEPTYQSFNKKTSFPNFGGNSSRNVESKYSSIEVPIGFRHYMFLNKKSKLFINGSVVIDIAKKDSKIDFEFGEDIEIEPQANLAFGLGYRYNDKYSIELRHFTNRQFFKNFRNQGSNFNTISLIFGYTLPI